MTVKGSSVWRPRWSPDGKYLDYAQRELAIIRVGEDEPAVLTESLDRNIFDPLFAADGGSIYFLLEDDGMVHLAAVSVDAGSVSRPNCLSSMPGHPASLLPSGVPVGHYEAEAGWEGSTPALRIFISEVYLKVKSTIDRKRDF